jgi:hypothetical protein
VVAPAALSSQFIAMIFLSVRDSQETSNPQREFLELILAGTRFVVFGMKRV